MSTLWRIVPDRECVLVDVSDEAQVVLLLNDLAIIRQSPPVSPRSAAKIAHDWLRSEISEKSALTAPKVAAFCGQPA
jgi:hypothetical protein